MRLREFTHDARRHARERGYATSQAGTSLENRRYKLTVFARSEFSLSLSFSLPLVERLCTIKGHGTQKT